MLIAVLIFSILSFILNGLLLWGFWDLYKHVREIRRLAQNNASNEVSKHLQEVGAAQKRRKR